MLLQPDDAIQPITLAQVLTDKTIDHNRRFSFRAGALREMHAAHKAKIAEYRQALLHLRNLGEAAKMIDGRRVAEIASAALKGKS